MWRIVSGPGSRLAYTPAPLPPLPPLPEQYRPCCVVVLTDLRGQRMLSHASLMTAAEAEREVRSWRHTRPDWGAVVRRVEL